MRRKRMINKQNLWFLTLFSLILVLSVYYITMPNDLLVAKKAADKTEEKEEQKNVTTENVTKEEKTEEKEDTTTIEESDSLTALRVSVEEEREEEKTELKKTMTNENATTDEKNNAYEQLKYLSEVEGQEEKIEKKIKETYKLDNFVKIDNNQVKVVAVSEKHDTTLANNIMRSVQENFNSKMIITVKFEK